MCVYACIPYYLYITSALCHISYFCFSIFSLTCPSSCLFSEHCTMSHDPYRSRGPKVDRAPDPGPRGPEFVSRSALSWLHVFGPLLQNLWASASLPGWCQGQLVVCVPARIVRIKCEDRRESPLWAAKSHAHSVPWAVTSSVMRVYLSREKGKERKHESPQSQPHRRAGFRKGHLGSSKTPGKQD